VLTYPPTDVIGVPHKNLVEILRKNGVSPEHKKVKKKTWQKYQVLVAGAGLEPTAFGL
jgi:hypothetical protein